MARELRHVTIPDTHNRISAMAPEGIEMIAKADDETLRQTIRSLARGILLSDQQWTVYYYVKDELLERGAWVDGLDRAGK